MAFWYTSYIYRDYWSQVLIRVAMGPLSNPIYIA